MPIKTINELQEKIDEVYWVEKDYELVRQYSIFLKKRDKSLKMLVTSLSLGSSEHKEILEEIIHNFRSLKVPEKSDKSYHFNFDFEKMSLSDILSSLIDYERKMEDGYTYIYLNTDDSLIKRYYKGNILTFYWLFRSLLLDERNHESMILDFYRNLKDKKLSKKS
ncbi:MAG: hypothetical protein ACP5RY_06165 [Thermoplasmata archaeon]